MDTKSKNEHVIRFQGQIVIADPEIVERLNSLSASGLGPWRTELFNLLLKVVNQKLAETDLQQVIESQLSSHILKNKKIQQTAQ
ncbi:MAG: hypothetical protein C5B58_01095 [Acidobacteria bacterium]|nr:MAG: hypothetical protein C5B58_01095 [Acidobacteriota bacterium]